MFDGKAFGEEIVGLVRDYLDKELAPLKAENEDLKARLKALESRPAPELDLAPVEKLIEAEIAKLPEIPELPDLGELIGPAVNEAIAALPPPEPGKPGEDGKSVDPEDVRTFIRGEVAKAVEALPAPKDGKDAANIREALKHDGELVLTLEDGRLIKTGIRDGEKGQDGRDGFGFEDLDACVLDDDRTIELCFRRGDEEKAFTFKWPTLIYRGIFREGENYERGDAVTFGGHLWHCDEPTTEKPVEKKAGEGPWTIAAKKGRDGKDAK